MAMNYSKWEKLSKYDRAADFAWRTRSAVVRKVSDFCPWHVVSNPEIYQTKSNVKRKRTVCHRSKLCYFCISLYLCLLRESIQAQSRSRQRVMGAWSNVFRSRDAENAILLSKQKRKRSGLKSTRYCSLQHRGSALVRFSLPLLLADVRVRSTGRSACT